MATRMVLVPSSWLTVAIYVMFSSPLMIWPGQLPPLLPTIPVASPWTWPPVRSVLVMPAVAPPAQIARASARPPTPAATPCAGVLRVPVVPSVLLPACYPGVCITI